MDHTFRIITAATVALAVAGCGGGDGIPREPVSGKITLDGSPLEDGLITFTPEDVTKPAAGTAIKNGSYSMGRSDGPPPGPNKVRITCRKPTGKKLKSTDFPGTFVDEMHEILPPQYNIDSRLDAPVKAGGENKFDYDLSSGTSKPKPKP